MILLQRPLLGTTARLPPAPAWLQGRGGPRRDRVFCMWNPSGIHPETDCPASGWRTCGHEKRNSVWMQPKLVLEADSNNQTLFLKHVCLTAHLYKNARSTYCVKLACASLEASGGRTTRSGRRKRRRRDCEQQCWWVNTTGENNLLLPTIPWCCAALVSATWFVPRAERSGDTRSIY